MIIKIQQEDRGFVWVSIEEVNVYSETKNLVEHTGEYICYLKHSEKHPLIVFGAPLVDDNNKPILFKTQKEVIKYVEKLINEC
jgi:hypothetical protein